MSARSETTNQTIDNPGLEKNSVGLSGVIGQSLSAMALSGVIATFVPVVVITVGAHGWVVWAIGTVIMLLIATSVAYLSRHLATTGGLYGLAAGALGPLGALLCGWLMVILLGIANVSAVLNFGAYFGDFLHDLGLPYNSAVLIISALALLTVCWYLSHVGAKLAAWVMFVTEIVTTTIFAILFVIVLIRKPDQIVDTQELTTNGLSLSAVISTVVIAVGAFTGFESASIYGREARNPRRTIPLAMVLSVIFSGIAWMIASYILFAGFNNNVTALSQSPAPMSDLAENLGMKWYAEIIDLVISFTVAAAVMAAFAWLSRMMLTMGREGVAPRSWATVDPHHRTPKRSLAIVFVVWAILTVVFGLISDNPIDTFGDFLASLAGLPGLLVYALVAAAAVVYHWREGRKIGVVTVTGILGALAMLYTLYTNIIPWPAFPSNLVVILFAVSVVLIIVLFLWLRKNRPHLISGIGASVRIDTQADADTQPATAKSA